MTLQYRVGDDIITITHNWKNSPSNPPPDSTATRLDLLLPQDKRILFRLRKLFATVRQLSDPKKLPFLNSLPLYQLSFITSGFRQNNFKWTSSTSHSNPLTVNCIYYQTTQRAPLKSLTVTLSKLSRDKYSFTVNCKCNSNTRIFNTIFKTMPEVFSRPSGFPAELAQNTHFSFTIIDIQLLTVVSEKLASQVSMSSLMCTQWNWK